MKDTHADTMAELASGKYTDGAKKVMGEVAASVAKNY